MVITLIVIAVAVILFIAGIVLGMIIEEHRKSVGTLVIDQTGEKDLWTVIFDEDLGDVEKEMSVVLQIRRKT